MGNQGGESRDVSLPYRVLTKNLIQNEMNIKNTSDQNIKIKNVYILIEKTVSCNVIVLLRRYDSFRNDPVLTSENKC